MVLFVIELEKEEVEVGLQLRLGVFVEEQLDLE